MKNLSIYIVDTDPDYLKAFARVIALDHAGLRLEVMRECASECAKNCDVCLFPDGYANDQARRCERAVEPVCGKYAGAGAILAEAAAFAAERSARVGGDLNRSVLASDAGALSDGALICVFAWAGGVGTSCAALGVARELARYRGETALYLSLEDAEDASLFPENLHAMRAEEVVYRYLRLARTDASRDLYARLFRAAAARDEYGLYRFAPDEGRGSFAGFGADELLGFLLRLASALELTRVVLDFGTRLYLLAAFAAALDKEKTVFLEVIPESSERDGEQVRRVVFGNETDQAVLPAVFPVCDEDVRRVNGRLDVGLSNAFGLVVKEVCDKFTGEMI